MEPKVHYHIHNSPLPVSTLSQINLDHAPSSHFLKIHFDINLTWVFINLSKYTPTISCRQPKSKPKVFSFFSLHFGFFFFCVNCPISLATSSVFFTGAFRMTSTTCVIEIFTILFWYMDIPSDTSSKFFFLYVSYLTFRATCCAFFTLRALITLITSGKESWKL